MEKPKLTIHLYRYHVTLRNQESGEETVVSLTLDGGKLQAAKAIGESPKGLLARFAARNGYELLGVNGKPAQLAVSIPLDELWRHAEEDQARWDFLCGAGGD